MKEDKAIEKLSRIFTDPIVLYPPGEIYLIPLELREEIELERIAQIANGHPTLTLIRKVKELLRQ